MGAVFRDGSGNGLISSIFDDYQADSVSATLPHRGPPRIPPEGRDDRVASRREQQRERQAAADIGHHPGDLRDYRPAEDRDIDDPRTVSGAGAAALTRSADWTAILVCSRLRACAKPYVFGQGLH